MIRFYWRCLAALQTRRLSRVARIGIHDFGASARYFDLLALDTHFGSVDRPLDAGLRFELDEAEASRAAVLVTVHHESFVHRTELAHRCGEVQFVAS